MPLKNCPHLCTVHHSEIRVSSLPADFGNGIAKRSDWFVKRITVKHLLTRVHDLCKSPVFLSSAITNFTFSDEPTTKTLPVRNDFYKNERLKIRFYRMVIARSPFSSPCSSSTEKYFRCLPQIVKIILRLGSYENVLWKC